MIPTLTTLRELDTRVNNGIHVRLLWCDAEDRLSVAVTDLKSGEAFSIEVRNSEQAFDVFHHPYAYAAWHGVKTRMPPRCTETEPAEDLAA
jgi:hypothetical protein